jgi:ribosomal protein L16 Arg81 hydroxylase
MENESHSKVFDLTALLAPARAEEFFREHWERKPLHLSRGDAHYYDPILTNADLESIISSADLRYPAIQLAKNGAYLAPEAYTKNIKHGSESFSGVPDLSQIQSEYRSGATVVLPALQRTWPHLRLLCATLEDDFSHPAHANAYLTPGDSPGFSPHYDTHEVFVLQIAGTKRWRVFRPPQPLPHRSQPFSPIGYILPPPLLELELEPGDLLYLPRGFVHATHTSATHSAHVTVGITVYTWIELIGEFLAVSKDIADFRVALPPGFATRETLRDGLKEGLLRRVNQLRDSTDIDRLITIFMQRVRSDRARPEETFQSEVRAIGLRTRLRAPEADRYCLTLEGRSVVMEFEGRKFALPDPIRVTIEDMCSKKTFQPGDLAGPLDNEGKLRLVRYLYEERFLTVV